MRIVAQYFLIILLLLVSSVVVSQHKKIDSLLRVLESSSSDTTKVNTLNQLSRLYLRHNPDTARVLSSEALALAEKSGSGRHIGQSYLIYANTFWVKGEYPEALKNYMKSLKAFERVGYKKGIASANSGIGLVYLEQEEHEKALNYYVVALKINEEIGERRNTSNCLSNIANIYRNLLIPDSALAYGFLAMNMNEELGDRAGMAISYGNIGNYYSDKGDHKAALEYKLRSLEIAGEMNDIKTVSIDLATIAESYMLMEQYARAESYFLRSLRIADSLGLLLIVREVHNGLSHVYEKTGQYKLSVDHYKKYVLAKDSIANEENTKNQTRLEMEYEFGKEQITDSIRNVEFAMQERIKYDQEIAQQRLYTIVGAAGFLLMLVASGISFRAYRQKQSANMLISRQKDLVEEKQKEILDSIHYAKRIQLSLLPAMKYIDRSLKRLVKSE